MEATFYYMFPHAKPNIVPGADRRVRAQFTFSAGAHAAIVEVDKNTGSVHVLRYLIVGDNGTVINPDVVNGQVYGSAAHGIAVALGEGFMYSPEGQPLTITYLDYGKCSTAETPRVEVIHQPSPSPFTPLGQKAAGEGAAIPSPAAIASAVEDALAALRRESLRAADHSRSGVALDQSQSGKRAEDFLVMIPGSFEYFAPRSFSRRG